MIPMPAPRYKLWIDGVGCWNLSFGTEWTIGGPGSSAHVELLAPLDNAAGVIHFEDAGYRLTQEDTPRDLATTDYLEWSSGVALAFRQPHPWTPTATLQPASPHRPVDSSDGLVLAAGPCVLGAEQDYHIVCRDWPHGLVLFERDDALHWKQFDGPADTNKVNRLGPDALIETDDVRVQIERC